MSKKSSVKQYFKSCFETKLLIRKGIIAGAAFLLVLAFSLSFYLWLRDKPEGLYGKENGFWYIEIVWNKGVGFSQLSGNLAAIFVLQTLMFILLTSIFLLICKDNITSSFVALAMFGGLFNLIQRACTPDSGVLDYFRFGFWKSFAVFNWPDIFVVIGIFGFVISFIVLMIIHRNDDEEEEKPAVEESPVPLDPSKPQA